MKKKVLIFGVIILGITLFKFNFNNDKEEIIYTKREEKEINKEVEEDNLYESKLYATVYNDVINDYSKKSVSVVNYDEVNNVEVNNEEIIVEESKEEKVEEVSYEEKKEEVNEVKEEEKVEDNNSNIEQEKEEETTDINEENNSEVSLASTSCNEVSVVSTNENNEILDVKNGFIQEDGITYYYENGNKVTGVKNIDGVNHYFSPIGKYLGTNNIKVIDVSFYQGDINWDLFITGDYYGVILRLGYYTFLDKKFERNISELKRLNIPYGIYLFSYSTTLTGAKKEASFVSNSIDKYGLNPTLGIYYDIESWTSSNSSSDYISNDMYDQIIDIFVNNVSSHVNNNYKVGVYSCRWYAENRLNNAKKYVDWVAEYNATCKYSYPYSMWQYTSKESVLGIEGNVDVSYIL